ncbi:MAG: polymer-forming cytoskeletal protein [Polyangiaceae bacterium]|jgi:cytoskeletal protein CcmA (bactofilin family)|nr:polymer-forming cytoskeletal protein [Polyangiaceae bacterium]
MADSVAIIGQATFIRGNIRGAGNLTIAGRVEGAIDVDGEVVLEETAIVRSSVSALRVVVRGAIVGNLSASESIALEPGARVVGDLNATRIRIDEGGLLRGRIEVGTPIAKPAPATVARAAAPPQRVVRTARVAAVARPAPPPPRTPVRRVAPPAPPPQPEPEPESEPEPQADAAPSIPKPAPKTPARLVTARSPARPVDASDESEQQAPPPPVVPALKKKSKGSVRKRNSSKP